MTSKKFLLSLTLTLALTVPSAKAGTFFDVPTLGGPSATGPIVDDSWDGFANGDVTVSFEALPDSGETEGFDNDGDKTLSNTPLKDILGLTSDTPYNRLRNNAVVGTSSSTVSVNDLTAGLANVYLMLLDVDTKFPGLEEVVITSGGNALSGSRFVGAFDDSDDSTHDAEFMYDNTTGVYSLVSDTNTSDYLSVFDITGLSSVDLSVNANGIQFQVAVVPVPEPASAVLAGACLVLGLMGAARRGR